MTLTLPHQDSSSDELTVVESENNNLIEEIDGDNEVVLATSFIIHTQNCMTVEEDKKWHNVVIEFKNDNEEKLTKKRRI